MMRPSRSWTTIASSITLNTLRNASSDAFSLSSVCFLKLISRKPARNERPPVVVEVVQRDFHRHHSPAGYPVLRLDKQRALLQQFSRGCLALAGLYTHVKLRHPHRQQVLQGIAKVLDGRLVGIGQPQSLIRISDVKRQRAPLGHQPEELRLARLLHQTCLGRASLFVEGPRARTRSHGPPPVGPTRPAPR